MNNRPLKHIEDNVKYPVLTTNSMILERETTVLK